MAATPSLLSEWDAQGYCVAESLLSQGETAHLRTAALEVAREVHGEAYLNKKISLELMSQPLFRPLLLDPRILGLARELLGPQIVYFGDSKISVMDRRGKFHKDNGRRGSWPGKEGYDPFDPEDGPYNVLRFMIYLQDHREFAGNLRVRSGSHNDPVPKLQVLPRDMLFWMQGRLKTRPGVPRGRRRNLNTALGDVVAFNLRTTHGVNAIRLDRFPSLGLDPSIERFVPTSLRAPETERVALQITFGAPGVHLDRFITSRMRQQFVHRYRASTMDSPETRSLADQAGLELRFDLLEFARSHAESR